MKYFLGIDQGGTKTAAAIIDEAGNLSGIGYAKGAYFPAQSPELAASEIRHAANAALAQAQLKIYDIHRVIAGITGVDYPGDDAVIRAALKQSLTADSIKDICIYNDAVIALYSGTLSDYGLVVCAGTGLNMAICQKKNKYFVFGDHLGEELQGGSAIARRGIKAVFDTKLGIRDAEKLTELFLQFSGADTVEKLLCLYMRDEDFQSRIRLIVPEMMELALSGDGESDRIFCEFAKELVIYIRAGLKNAGLLERSVPLILTGSVFKGSRNPLVKYLTEQIHNAAPKAVISNAKYEPVVGACVMGILQQKSFTEKMKQNLSESAEKMGLLRK